MLVSLLFFLDMGSFNAILEIGEGRIKLKFGKFFFFLFSEPWVMVYTGGRMSWKLLQICGG